MSEDEDQATFSPFDFSDFFEFKFLTDCEIRIYDSDRTSFRSVPAHRVVLANSSVFFYNTFTSHMTEELTGIVEVVVSVPELFESIITWFYTGLIDFDESHLMLLLDWSQLYGIIRLRDLVLDALPSIVNPDNLIGFIQQCFDYEIADPLQFLEPAIGHLFRELSISVLSEALDVSTFARALKYTDLSNVERVAAIETFLGDWQPTLDEKNSLAEALLRDPSLREVVRPGIRWLPAPFVAILQ
jgi:hypothetical protein